MNKIKINTLNHKSAFNTGSALTVVLVTAMVVSLLVLTALYVTGIGRDVTANYTNYTSMYDLAVAGNEHALLIFNDILENPSKYEDENTEGDTRNITTRSDMTNADENKEKEISIEAIAEIYERVLDKNNFVHGEGYKLTWSAEVTTDIRETFAGETVVARSGNDFNITTKIEKNIDGQTSYPATVLLEIKWPHGTNNFDGSKLPVLKSKRILD